MDRYSSEQMARDIASEVAGIKVNMSQLNMMVIGKTGTGKSTLINGMFGEDLARTGTGFPVTMEVGSYSKNNYPFIIMDWPGFELEGDKSINVQFEDIKKVISLGNKSKKPQNMIHCILYCVSATSHRFEEAEIDFVRKLLAETGRYKIPVILVITQAFMKKDTQLLKESIEESELAFSDVVPVLVQDVDLEDYIKKAYGLDRLAAAISRVISDDLKNTLECVQQVNIRMMTRRAVMYVNGFATKAGALGLKPIFRKIDIYPIIVSTLANISAVYDIGISQEFIEAVSALIEDSEEVEIRQNKILKVVRFLEPTVYLANSAYVGVQAGAVITSLGQVFIKYMNLISSKEMSAEELDPKALVNEFNERFATAMRRNRHRRIWGNERK
ncbi:MAG: septin family protein [Lachnospiraceae bacterium]|nr:septin family protein [Lachnospiraceae bacterium]